MTFITRHRKAIALIAVFSFFYLIGVGSLPLDAVASASADQQPGAIEKIGASGTHAVKKSPIIPIIIGVVVVGAVAAVLILVVLKTKYDITGTWSGPFTEAVDEESFTATVVFTGDKKSGTLFLSAEGESYNGTYSVDEKAVTFILDLGGGDTVTFTGSFSSKDQMSGTWQNDQDPAHGTWELNRGVTVASSIPSPAITTSAFKKK